MTTRAYVLLGILAILTLSAAVSRADETTRIIQLRTPNQISTSVGGVVLPKPQLDILESPAVDHSAWEEVRLLRIQNLTNSLLEKILFDFDSSEIDEEGQQIAGKIAALLLQNQDVGMTLSGHTDLMGSEEYNQALSERRAAAVQALLVSLKVPADRLKTAAFGKRAPAINAVRKERLNRRVEGTIFEAVKPVRF